MVDLPLKRIAEFIKKVVPFDSLSSGTIEELLPKIEIAYYPRGRRIIEHGDPSPSHLHIINVGAARIQLSDELGEVITVDVRGEADVFGAVSILSGKEALFDIIADEDIIAFLLPANEFKDLVARYPVFQRTFHFSLARAFKAVRASSDSRQATQLSGGMPVDMYMTTKQVKDLMSPDVLTCPPDTSIREAARLMSRRHVASIIIRADDGAPIGIVSDRDLRSKVVACDITHDRPVRDIMSSPLYSIPPNAFAFDALLDMTHYGISHLPVIEDGRLTGIISEHDFRTEMGSSPVGVIADIEKARTLKELAGVRHKLDSVREKLLHQVGSIKKMIALITELNDRVTLRLLTLTKESMENEGLGAPPLPYSWIAMGSEGRLEQTLRTDQDNALVIMEKPSADTHAARQWFLKFAERVVEGLDRFGFPRCRGGFMASNPEWCLTENQWVEKFVLWVQEPTPISLRLCTVFFDLRCLDGDHRFEKKAWDHIFRAIEKNPLFLRSLARNALYNIPPLGFLRTFVVEKSGENKNELNLKMKGLTPVVDAARVLSLDMQLRKTNTFDRLKAVHDNGILDDDLFADLQEAYSFIFYLRISKHIEALSEGIAPDNFIDPAGLNNLQRKMLKESFTAINRLQELIQYRYQTQLLPGS